MRKLLFIALRSITAASAQPVSGPKQTPLRAKNLTRAKLDELLADPVEALLIDVRRLDESSSNGGFPIYLSIQAGELEKHLVEVPKDRAGTVGVEDYAAEGGKIVKIEIPKRAAPKL
jgi:hypothetical protein